MPVALDKQIQVEYGECQTSSLHPSDGQDIHSPSILVIHCSGSTYRQFSQLPSFLPPNSCSRVYGLNLWGSGRTDPWPGDLRVQTLADQTQFVIQTTKAAIADQTKAVGGGSDQKWHLIGHSFGGFVAVSAVGMDREFSEKVSELTLFEPNPFYLLSAGNQEERDTLEEYQRRFHQTFNKWCFDTRSSLSEEEIIEIMDYMTQDFYQFFFGNNFASLTPEQKPKMFPHGITSTHASEHYALKDSLAIGPRLAPGIIKNIARVDKKRLIVSRNPGPGARNLLKAMGTLLEREAGFELVEAEVGDHLAPITHKQQIFPLFFK